MQSANSTEYIPNTVVAERKPVERAPFNILVHRNRSVFRKKFMNCYDLANVFLIDNNHWPFMRNISRLLGRSTTDLVGQQAEHFLVNLALLG